MKGDFSRFTFDPNKGYTGVRMQQGRVQLDADWNEQVDILLHQLRIRFQDLAGSPTGAGNGGSGPVDRAGFEIRVRQEETQGTEDGNPHTRPAVEIGPGRYYVDGFLCENRHPVAFDAQPDYPGAALPDAPDPGASYLLYLDVWEQHLTGADDPDIREPALGGLDTTTRTRTVWQVKWLPLQGEAALEGDLQPAEWAGLVERAADKPRLTARWQPSSLGLDNQLYRVEIHDVDEGHTTFKWSRENGAVQFPIVRLDSSGGEGGDGRLIAEVEGLHDLTAIRQWDSVELVDATSALNGHPQPLCQVLEPPVQAGHLTRLTLSLPQALCGDPILQLLEPGLRQRRARLCRWDHASGGAPGIEASAEVQHGTWLPLERGIEVHFEPGGHYQSGDYWLIPARSTGEKPLLWPHDSAGEPLPQPPHGVYHHLSPLALLGFDGSEWLVRSDLRTTFDPLLRATARDEGIEARIARLEVDLWDLQSRIEDPAGIFETYRSIHRLGRGDVVALDPATGRIVPADRDNAALVVGVVAAAFERDGVNHCKVVHSGRTMCKVDGEIEPGDVLVPSTVSGTAARGGLYVQPGTVVGKALAAHPPACDPCEIEIMVALR